MTTTISNKIKNYKQFRVTPFLATIGGIPIATPIGLRTEFTGPGALGSIISLSYAFVLPIVGIIAFLIFLWTGFQFLLSKGEPKAIEGAKARFTYAVIGMIILVLAWSALQLARTVFGLGVSGGAGGPGGCIPGIPC